MLIAGEVIYTVNNGEQRDFCPGALHFCVAEMEKKFECKRCGNCCRWSGYVRIDSSEIDAIAAFLGFSSEEFIAKYTRLTADRSGLSLLENPDGSCPYLVDSPEGPACRLQAVKPRQCCDFPLKWNFPGWEKECAGGKVMQEKSQTVEDKY